MLLSEGSACLLNDTVMSHITINRGLKRHDFVFPKAQLQSLSVTYNQPITVELRTELLIFTITKKKKKTNVLLIRYNSEIMKL